MSVYFANQDERDRQHAAQWLAGTDDFMRAIDDTAKQNVLLKASVFAPPLSISWCDRMSLEEAVRILAENSHASDSVVAQARETYNRAHTLYTELLRNPQRGDFAAVVAAKLAHAARADHHRLLIVQAKLEEEAHKADRQLGRQLAALKREKEHPLTLEDVARLLVVQNFSCVYCLRVMRFVQFRHCDPAQFTIGRIRNDHAHVYSNVVCICLGCQGQRNGVAKEELALRRMCQNDDFDTVNEYTLAGIYDVNPLLVMSNMDIELMGVDCVEVVRSFVAKHEIGADDPMFDPLRERPALCEPQRAIDKKRIFLDWFTATYSYITTKRPTDPSYYCQIKDIYNKWIAISEINITKKEMIRFLRSICIIPFTKQSNGLCGRNYVSAWLLDALPQPKMFVNNI